MASFIVQLGWCFIMEEMCVFVLGNILQYVIVSTKRLLTLWNSYVFYPYCIILIKKSWQLGMSMFKYKCFKKKLVIGYRLCINIAKEMSAHLNRYSVSNLIDSCSSGVNVKCLFYFTSFCLIIIFLLINRYKYLLMRVGYRKQNELNLPSPVATYMCNTDHCITVLAQLMLFC